LPPTRSSLSAAADRRDHVHARGRLERCVEPGPSLRRHINVYVDGERAGLDATLEPSSRVDVIAAISGG
jgi:sulfur-carrier protein